MFPIKDSVPSRSTPVATRALILVNVIVFFFELGLSHQSVEQLFYLFGLVPARFTHPDWALAVGFPVDSFWPILTHQFLHGGWSHIVSEYVDPLDFRRQRRGQNGSDPLYDFLFALRTAAGLTHLYVNPDSTVPSVGASGAIAGVLGAYFLFSQRPASWRCFRSSFFHFFRTAGCVLSGPLVFHSNIQRNDGPGRPTTGRWHRLVGAHRRIFRRNVVMPVVCEEAEPPNAT